MPQEITPEVRILSLIAHRADPTYALDLFGDM